MVAQMRLTGPVKAIDPTRVPGWAGGMPPARLVDRALERHLLPLACELGNLRVHGMTLAASDDVGDDSGFVVLVVRARFDRDRLRQALRKRLGDVEVEKVGRHEVLLPEHELALLIPSSHRFILVAGPNWSEMPLKELTAALARGEGDLKANRKLAGLIKSVNENGPLWAAATVTPTYRKLEVLEPFQRVMLTSEFKSGKIVLRGSARGEGAEAIAASVKQVRAAVDGMREGVGKWQQEVPSIEPVKTFLDSIRAEPGPDGATFSAELTRGAGSDLLPMPYVWLSMFADM